MPRNPLSRARLPSVGQMLTLRGVICNLWGMSSPNPDSPLYVYRQLLGLTYEEMAERFRVNKTTARYWECTRVPAERVPQISLVTGIQPHVLRPDLYDLQPKKGRIPTAQEATAPPGREAVGGSINMQQTHSTAGSVRAPRATAGRPPGVRRPSLRR